MSTNLLFSVHISKIQLLCGQQFKNISINKDGFGVFAFNTYESDIKTISPSFMYNQKVASTNKGNSWNYSPVKYWPTSSSSTENK